MKKDQNWKIYMKIQLIVLEEAIKLFHNILSLFQVISVAIINQCGQK